MRKLPLYCYIFMLFLVAACGAPENKSSKLTPAFPGAEGFGSFSQGGRGGDVYLITTLADYGANEPVIEGSLRQAVEATGPRTVVFRTSGLIALKRDLQVSNPYITIAGQTAPGDGICLKNYPLLIDTDHVIVRYIRSRLGEDMHLELDAVSINKGNNIILDHCSGSWSTDEVISSYSELVTIQWCIIAEGLMHSFHPKGPHSMGSIIEGKHGGISLLHNIYAHNNSRNPLIQNKGEQPGAIVEIRGNLMYNWGETPGYTADPGQARINYMNNYLKPGPSTSKASRMFAFNPENAYTNMYMADNYHTENAEGSQNNTKLLWCADTLATQVLLKAPYPMFEYVKVDPKELYESLLKNTGAILPVRDAVDNRIIQEIKTGSGKIINSQNDVGAWPAYKSADAPIDMDKDGMPDDWENQHGLDPKDPKDRNSDKDNDGYTALEEYLNNTDPGKPDVTELSHEEFEKVIARKDALHDSGMIAVNKRIEAEKQERQNRVVSPYVAKVVQIANSNNKELLIDGKKALQLNFVGAGKFIMGSPETEKGRDEWEIPHEVTLTKSYYLATVEMSNETIRLLTGMNNYPANALPASINWFDSEWVCEVLSKKTGKKFRLPTEAEWEYACRAGTTTPYFSGNDISLAQANFNTGDTTLKKGYRPVDQGIPNAWGFINMPGNQFEWCSDWKGNYTKDPINDPVGPAQDKSIRSFDGLYRKMMRGGNFGSSKEFLRSAYRYDYSRDVKYGFRVVLEQD